jgi:hypothetical protein
VELVDLDEKAATASYAAFSVGNEVEGYSLKVLAGYSGNAGDSLSYHAGSKFSTKDLDQDEWAEGSCAQAHSNLNSFLISIMLICTFCRWVVVVQKLRHEQPQW